MNKMNALREYILLQSRYPGLDRALALSLRLLELKLFKFMHLSHSLRNNGIKIMDGRIL